VIEALLDGLQRPHAQGADSQLRLLTAPVVVYGT
jgi:hypothetical protein